jgi:hypothetical protein
VTTTGALEDDTELMIHDISGASGESVNLDLAKGQVWELFCFSNRLIISSDTVVCKIRI